MSAELQTLSTRIDPAVRQALDAYCKRRGLKLRHVVEEAIVERIEDEIDLDAHLARKEEETISLEDLLAERNLGSRRRK
jgi:antitoxin component of RelBE/YafQ-DinJ toxin-antitoxin module